MHRMQAWATLLPLYYCRSSELVTPTHIAIHRPVQKGSRLLQNENAGEGQLAVLLVFLRVSQVDSRLGRFFRRPNNYRLENPQSKDTATSRSMHSVQSSTDRILPG